MRQPAHAPYAVALAIALIVSPGHAQDNPERPESFVAATRAFEFYSDPLLNLHDFLMRHTRSPEPEEADGPADNTQCLDSLPDADRDAFERAQKHYEETMAGRRWSDDVMRRVRTEIAGFSFDVAPKPAVVSTLEHLRAAAPAYVSCWWPEHNARNRVRVAQLVPRLIAHEDTLLARLAVVFGEEWDTPFPVDIIGWTSSSGANSIVNPDHIVMSSTDPDYGDDSGLEMVFHEAAHTVLGPGNGAVWHALVEAAAALDIEDPPGDLWHVVLFYTTGEVVQAFLAERGVVDYEAYLYRGGLFERAWPEFRLPLEQHWQPYLDGRIELHEAATRLLKAVSEAAPSTSESVG